MEITGYTEALRSDLSAVAESGDEQARAAGERLLRALEPSLRLRFLDALGEAAAELSAQLPEGRVELRLAGPEVTLAYVSESTAGGGHEVIVEAPRSRGFVLGRDASYLVTVSAPHGADLRARTASGEVSAQGRLGEAAVNTASGDVELDEVDGSVSVKTASGDVRVEDAGGDVTVRTVSGDARIGRAGGSAEIAVVSGDVEIGESGPTEVNSVSGDVAVGELTGGDARFRSVSGQMTIGVRS